MRCGMGTKKREDLNESGSVHPKRPKINQPDPAPSSDSLRLQTQLSELSGQLANLMDHNRFPPLPPPCFCNYVHLQNEFSTKRKNTRTGEESDVEPEDKHTRGGNKKRYGGENGKRNERGEGIGEWRCG
jgi:hypothetical protein